MNAITVALGFLKELAPHLPSLIKAGVNMYGIWTHTEAVLANNAPDTPDYAELETLVRKLRSEFNAATADVTGGESAKAGHGQNQSIKE